MGETIREMKGLRKEGGKASVAVRTFFSCLGLFVAFIFVLALIGYFA